MNKLSRGFTLIELIIVMAILGGIAVIFLSTFPGIQMRARDSRRLSELKQYQNALEVFAQRHDGLYPGRSPGNGAVAHTVLCGDLGMSSCPADPLDEVPYRYRYQTNTGGGNINAVRYVLWATLEAEEMVFVICSNGTSGEVDASTSFSGGACPL